MRKVLSLISACLCLVLLAGCVNHKNQYFIEGYFYGESGSDIYSLQIKTIDYDTYANAKGANVVKDVIIKSEDCYYQINLYVQKEDGFVQIQLVNLADSNQKTKAEPVVYVDDNGTSICPMVDRPDYYKYGREAYSASYNGEQVSFDNTYYHESAFKGLEVYCWQQDNNWVAGLMGGTNRYKTADEVNNLFPVTLNEMKTILNIYEKDKDYTRIVVVSRPCLQAEIDNSYTYIDSHPQTYSFLISELGLEK